jgi:peptidoglycan/xylan/chitin deacetylase (PgdA/CDA1 family)
VWLWTRLPLGGSVEAMKSWVKYVFDRLLTGLGVLIYRAGLAGMVIALNRRAAKVLMYHACEDVESEFTRGLSINTTPSEFADHLDFLKRHYRVLPLARVLEGPTTEPTVVITFDDGFRSVYENAWPRLRERRLSATCYLTTDVIGNRALVWINELNWFFHHHAAVARPIIREFLGVEPTCPHEVVMLRLVDRYNPVSIARLLDQLRSVASVDPETLARQSRLHLDWDEITEMSAAGIAFGNHTGSHPSLNALSPAECHAEISRACEAISSVAGETKTMAYPFGTKNEAARQIAIDFGIQAILEVHGVNHPFDCTRIGRIKVGSHSAAVLFARMEVVEPVKTWLKQWLRPSWSADSARDG